MESYCCIPQYPQKRKIDVGLSLAVCILYGYARASGATKEWKKEKVPQKLHMTYIPLQKAKSSYPAVVCTIECLLTLYHLHICNAAPLRGAAEV